MSAARDSGMLPPYFHRVPGIDRVCRHLSATFTSYFDAHIMT